MQPHRILLRGPWEFEWLSDDVKQSQRHEPIEKNTLPATSGRVQMPTDWQSLFGNMRGTARFRRHFHRPTNLEPHERVFIVFDGVGGTGHVELNGQRLGNVDLQNPQVDFDVTDCLSQSNSLVVELQCGTGDDELQARGLWGPVAVEIRVEAH